MSHKLRRWRMRPWWKDNRLVWTSAALAVAKYLIATILGYCLATFRRITTNPLLTAFVAFILATVAVASLTIAFYSYDGGFLKNILVEAHGMLLDILVIGIFILWLNRLGEKRLEIRRYQEEIDDFRGWDSDEAGYRIAGNIKRLNRNGITNIVLNQCHLVNVNLARADLRGAHLTFADLSHAKLIGADLRNATLFVAHLHGTDLSEANLSHAILREANLSHAHLSEANLHGTDLRKANLSHAHLFGANLSSADLRDADLFRADLYGVDLSDANLSEAKLSHAHLFGVDLSSADLSSALLRDAYLFGVHLSHANLGDADLYEANLEGAKGWTNEQLARAESLVGATLPDGTVMTEDAWEEFKKQYRQSSQAG